MRKSENNRDLDEDYLLLRSKCNLPARYNLTTLGNALNFAIVTYEIAFKNNIIRHMRARVKKFLLYKCDAVFASGDGKGDLSTLWDTLDHLFRIKSKKAPDTRLLGALKR